MYRFSTFILLLFLLTGCTEEEETIEKEQEVIRTVYEKNSKPLEVSIVGNGNQGILVNVDRYCWNEDISVCEAKEPRNPKEAVSEINLKKLAVAFGEKVMVYYSADPSLPKADDFELVQYVDDEIIPTEITYDNNGNFSFIAPSIQGPHYYLLKAIVDNEFKGISYYPFAILVQPE